jgi:hypothetical protein
MAVCGPNKNKKATQRAEVKNRRGMTERKKQSDGIADCWRPNSAKEQEPKDRTPREKYIVMTDSCGLQSDRLTIDDPRHPTNA